MSTWRIPLYCRHCEGEFGPDDWIGIPGGTTPCLVHLGCREAFSRSTSSIIERRTLLEWGDGLHYLENLTGSSVGNVGGASP